MHARGAPLNPSPVKFPPFLCPYHIISSYCPHTPSLINTTHPVPGMCRSTLANDLNYTHNSKSPCSTICNTLICTHTHSHPVMTHTYMCMMNRSLPTKFSPACKNDPLTQLSSSTGYTYTPTTNCAQFNNSDWN